MLSELLALSQRLIANKQQAYQRYLLQDSSLSHRLCIVIGARGVGKTTLLIQHMLATVQGNVTSDKILYVPVDHFLLQQHRLYDIAEQFSTLGGQCIAFDEIHNYPHWSLELKSIYDTFPELTVIASGSSALEIHKGSHDLSRRALIFTMQGLSLREYIALTHGIELPVCTLPELLASHAALSQQMIKTTKAHDRSMLALFHEYLQRGYYPYAKELNTANQYHLTLEQNIHVTLESDMLAIYPELNGRTIAKLKQLLVFVAGNVPFTPKWTELKGLLQVGDMRTLKQYFHYLADAGLLVYIEKTPNKLNALASEEKVYLQNPNLLYTLSGQEPDRGTLRETFFMNMVSKDHALSCPKQGYFCIDQHHVFEIGGSKKGFSQIKMHKDAYVAADDIEYGSGYKIPLWLFGMLY